MRPTKIWSNAIIVTFTAAIIAPVFYCANTDTLTLKTVNDVDIVSFDPSKLSEPKLRLLILL